MTACHQDLTKKELNLRCIFFISNVIYRVQMNSWLKIKVYLT